MQTVIQTAVLREIVPSGLTYGIDERRAISERGIPLEVRYITPIDKSLERVWEGRKNSGKNIFNKSGVWRRREALNFLGINTESYEECAANLVSLDGSEGANSGPFRLSNAAQYVGLPSGDVSFLYEGNNPSGSFKDRGTVVVATDGRRHDVKRYIVASTGNTAASMAAVIANEKVGGRYSRDVELIVIIPHGRVATEKLLQAQAYGAKIIQIDGDFDAALEMSRQLREIDPTMYPVNSYNPFRIEGQKTETFDIIEYLKQVPDWIITPGGNLGSTAAIHKALLDMREWGWIGKVPRIAVVNAANANTLELFYNREGVRWNHGDFDVRSVGEFYSELRMERASDRHRKRSTHMSAIDIHYPAEENMMKALRALEDTNGVVTSVTDAEAWEAKAVIDSNGMFMVDLASAAALAGLRRLFRAGNIERGQIVGVRLTGRDKDTGLSARYYNNPRMKHSNVPLQLPNDVEAVKNAIYVQ
ncbi:MAG: pyridoxal-phosphate dependent enzyme [Candidatus Aenigmarchaeota archaeon]|nr:pyridoxal-phosphate dependent enzyme [Candidatus Aenigmarchaeota archaeon]